MAGVGEFVRLVRDGEPNRSPGRGAFGAMRVAAAAERAFAEHRPVAGTEHVIAEAPAGHTLEETVNRALPFKSQST
jgi:hypothetical protein